MFYVSMSKLWNAPRRMSYIVVKLRHWAFIRCHMFIRKFLFFYFYEYIAPWIKLNNDLSKSKIIQIIGKKVINRHSRHYITHLIRKQEYPTFGWIPWSWFRYFYMVLMGSCLFKKKNQKLISLSSLLLFLRIL